MKKIIALIFTLALLGAAIVAWQAIEFISSPAQQESKDVVFEIPYGTAFYHVSHELESLGLIQSAAKFSWYAKFLRKTKSIKVGEYKLNTNMRPREILNILISGQSIAHSLTIPEGENIFEIRDQLNKMWSGRGDVFFKLVTNPKFVKELTGESLTSLEGFLYPETYAITKYTPTEQLVRRMYDYFQETMSAIKNNAKLKMPEVDQVTLASIIEKETGAPGERQLISSVFHNRLNKGMRLQSDPTIMYGIQVQTKETVKNISKADITRPTPYNTYTVKALPIGPIANPGKEALWAAVNPVESDYLYFVSKNDGTHIFTKTYKDHSAAVKKFQLDRRMREGKSWRDLKKTKPQKKTKSVKSK